MKKILIVDSGSTKTDWAFVTSDHQKIISSRGINPSSDKTLLSLKEYNSELESNTYDVSEVYYYGAGVIDTLTANKIKSWLLPYFDAQPKIQVSSDLLGACKSLAGDDPGIISIIGTGSNSCIYDGDDIVDNIPALGYTLGNEGAGTEIGKAILQSYFYRKMPTDVKNEFEELYPTSKSQVVTSLYLKENPTKYLASFAKFVNITNNKKWRKKILEPIFQQFIDIRIKPYEDFLSYELHFVGSIAYFCEDILKEVLENNNLQSVNIKQKPINGLINYHKKK